MTLTQIFKDIADAIRSKGISGTMKPGEMPEKIAGIKDASTMPRVKRVEAIPANIRSLSQSGTTLLTVESACDGLYDSAGKILSSDCIAERSAITMCSNIPLSRFGDAVAEGVAKGMTFTSEEGYKVKGTAELGNAYTYYISTENTTPQKDQIWYYDKSADGSLSKNTIYLTPNPQKVETTCDVLAIARDNENADSHIRFYNGTTELGSVGIGSDLGVWIAPVGEMVLNLAKVKEKYPTCTHIQLVFWN